MKIVITGLMGRGTLEAKIEPLSKIDAVSEILFVRKTESSSIEKTKYIIPPFINILKPLHLIITPLSLFHTVLKHKPKLIIGYHIVPYGFFVAVVGIITRTPYIISQTGIMIQKQSINKLLRKILHFVFKKSVQVNCPGNSSVLFWQNTYPNIKSKFQILHSTIDTDYFKPNLAVQKNYDFIFLGRLDELKRIHLIIKGFNHLIKSTNNQKAYRMVIVGAGPEENNLKNLVASLHLEEEVLFTGFIHDPLTILQQSKFLVMASRSEGLPTAMMQAMACGVITITNIVGNISDLILDSETGFVHKATEINIFKKMNVALNLKETMLIKIRNNARKLIIENHSYFSARKRWENILYII